MAYTFQTFSAGQILTAAQMNQVEVNVRDHVHGAAGVDDLSGNHTLTGTWNFPSITVDGAVIADIVGGYVRLGHYAGGSTSGTYLYVNGNYLAGLYPGGMIIGDHGTATPDTTLHVYRGSAGMVASHLDADMTLENNANHYIQMLAPKANAQGVIFGNPTDGEVDGYVIYDNPSRSILFATAMVNSISINSSGQLVSSLGTGTAPFIVASTTQVTNLNSQYLNNKGSGHSTNEIPISDGTVNATLNADMVDGLHAGGAVSGFVRGIVTQIEDNSNNPTNRRIVNITTLTAEDTWESYGPTGSGATRIRTALDDVSSNAKALILKCWIRKTSVAAGESAIYLYGRKTGTAWSVGIDVLLTILDDYAAAGSQSIETIERDIIIPIDSSRRFDLYWDTLNATTSNIILSLVGWIE